MTTQAHTDTNLPDLASSEDRIQSYLQRKERIVTECERHLLPLFRGLLNELCKAAQVINDQPPSSEGWVDEMKRLFQLLKPLRNDPPPQEVKPLIDILAAYREATGIELDYVVADESGLEPDEIILGFTCAAWRDLSKNELNTAAIAITQANLYLEHFDPNSVVAVVIPYLDRLDVDDLVVVRDKLGMYWENHLIWAKYRA